AAEAGASPAALWSKLSDPAPAHLTKRCGGGIVNREGNAARDSFSLIDPPPRLTKRRQIPRLGVISLPSGIEDGLVDSRARAHRRHRRQRHPAFTRREGFSRPRLMRRTAELP